MSKKILFRVDGNERIGAGHVLRSLALAQRLVEQGMAIDFVCRQLSSGLVAKIAAASLPLHRITTDGGAAEDCQQLLEIATNQDAVWIILDGYEFSDEYRRKVYQSGRQLLVVDDLGHDEFYHADVLVNSMPDAAEITYRHPSNAIVLLGPSFAPVGAEFRALRTPRAAHPRASKLLGTFGGSDPAGFSSRFLEAIALMQRSDLQARLIVGPANPRYEALRQLRDKLGIACELIVDPSNMPREMMWADLAITAAGSTCWELATLGVPALLVVTAENQLALATGLDRLGAAIQLGWGHAIAPDSLARAMSSLLDDAARRQRLCERGQELVDGRGTLRIHRAIVEATIQLSPVKSSDARLLFDWVNDPQTRASSFSPAPITWEEHCRWLDGRLGDRAPCVFWIARDANENALGQVRYDLHELKEQEAVVSTSVAAEHRRRGVARRLLQLSARRLFAERGIRRIHAFVRPENEASCRALTAAGYVAMPASTLRGKPARHYMLSRE